MKSGVCPKCKSESILVFTQDGKNKNADHEKLGTLSGDILSTRYVCCNCGYTERYFDDANLEKLKKKFKKVRG
jgi:transposase-like protein